MAVKYLFSIMKSVMEPVKTQAAPNNRIIRLVFRNPCEKKCNEGLKHNASLPRLAPAFRLIAPPIESKYALFCFPSIYEEMVGFQVDNLFGITIRFSCCLLDTSGLLGERERHQFVSLRPPI